MESMERIRSTGRIIRRRERQPIPRVTYTQLCSICGKELTKKDSRAFIHDWLMCADCLRDAIEYLKKLIRERRETDGDT